MNASTPAVGGWLTIRSLLPMAACGLVASASLLPLDYDEVRIFAGTDGYCAVAPQ